MNGTEEWIRIGPPCAEVGNVSLQRLLEAVGQTVCGGASIVDRYVTLCHSAPIADMNVDEFERPLRLVTHAAHRIERDLFGGNRY